MSTGIYCLRGPLDEAQKCSVADLALQVFGQDDRQATFWRLSNMPDVTVFLWVPESAGPVAFKAGYAATQHRYYSWLGGVHPEWRQRGLARQLMSAQHDWLESSRYTTVETHVAQANTSMVNLNLACGFVVRGWFMKGSEACFLMQKSLRGLGE